MKRISKGLLVIVFLFCFTFCARTVYVPVERKTEVIVEKHDTVILTKIERENVYVTANDTIAYAETDIAKAEASWRSECLSLHLENKDTVIPIKTHVVYKTINCTIPVPHPVDRVVEKKVTAWYDKVFRVIGGGSLFILIGFLFLKIKRYV